MKHDISRDGFNSLKHFSRVLMQQGRVQLDSDWNEQVSILLHYLRAMAADVIGPYGGPGDSFKIVPPPLLRPVGGGGGAATPPPSFDISPGHYYVQGILCENPALLRYTNQPYTELPTQAGDYLIYLDVWERLISYVEDNSILEVALGGVDTTARAQVVWQVRPIRIAPGDTADTATLMRRLEQINPARLRAQARTDQTSDDPCSVSPEAHYRRFENQLYRVEIHTGAGEENKPVTFKWSRDNGSVVFPIRSLQGKAVSLDGLGRDSRLSLNIDDWVEITDDETVLRGSPGMLFQVASVDLMEGIVFLKPRGNVSPPSYDETTAQRKHASFRRWDYNRAGQRQRGAEIADDGALKVKTGEWIDLEDGVQIQFGVQSPVTVAEVPEGGITFAAGNEVANAAREGAGNEDAASEERNSEESILFGRLNLRTADYWLIPARTATGDVVWPGAPGNPEFVAPHGVKHYYAPLARLNINETGVVTSGSIQDLRCSFNNLCSPRRDL